MKRDARESIRPEKEVESPALKEGAGEKERAIEHLPDGLQACNVACGYELESQEAEDFDVSYACLQSDSSRQPQLSRLKRSE